MKKFAVEMFLQGNANRELLRLRSRNRNENRVAGISARHTHSKPSLD
jgi:hypothetical protein